MAQAATLAPCQPSCPPLLALLCLEKLHPCPQGHFSAEVGVEK